MAAQSPELKKLVDVLSTVSRRVSQSAAALGKLEIDWKKVPTAHGPVGFADQACTQDNQCEPNPSCHINNGC